jgi:hypothetical protein
MPVVATSGIGKALMCCGLRMEVTSGGRTFHDISKIVSGKLWILHNYIA